MSSTSRGVNSLSSSRSVLTGSELTCMRPPRSGAATTARAPGPRRRPAAAAGEARQPVPQYSERRFRPPARPWPGRGVLRSTMKPSDQRALAGIQAELSRVVRYDDESIVNGRWIRQRYDCGCFPGLAPARKAAVEAAWHEAGHAGAALTVGARFSSASIHHGCASEGRVHGITGPADLAFVIDAAGQIAERLRNWTMLEHHDELRAWLPTWESDGGDARRFRRALRERFGDDECGAWRYSQQALPPHPLTLPPLPPPLPVPPPHPPSPSTTPPA